MMVRNKSEFVSSAGRVFEIVKALSEEVRDLGGNDVSLARILNDATLRHRVAELLVDNTRSGTIVVSFELYIDHGKTIEEMLLAGKYDEANRSAITDAYFPRQREGVETVMIDLVKFHDAGSTKEREHQLAVNDGYIGDMDAMLSIGAQLPELQRQFSIVFLGAVLVSPNGNRLAGCLGGNESQRYCNVDWAAHDSTWEPHNVFAVVRRK